MTEESHVEQIYAVVAFGYTVSVSVVSDGHCWYAVARRGRHSSHVKGPTLYAVLRELRALVEATEEAL